MTVLDVTPELATDRATWLKWRRGGVGGSDVAALVGESRWASPVSLFYEKTGALGDDHREETPRMRLGRRAEVMAAAEFHDHTDLHLIGAQTWVQHPDHPHHRATIDGAVAEYPHSTLIGALGGEETKVTEQYAARWSKVGLPLGYECQVQWAMHVTGWDRWWVLVFYGLSDTEVLTIDRDQGAIDSLVRMVDRFWFEHVQAGIPPAADSHDATTDALLAVYPTHSPHTEVDVDDFLGEITRLEEVRAEAKALKDEEKAIANTLRQALGDAEIGLVDNQPAVTYRSHHRAGYVVEATTVRQLRTVKGKT